MRMGDRAASVAAVYEVPTLAEAVREEHFHLLRLLERHRIEMIIQPWHETLAAPADDARGLDPLLVILEALLGRQTRHADVVAGLAVARGIAQVDDVHGVMIPRLLRPLQRRLRHRGMGGRLSAPAIAAFEGRGRSARAA